MIKGPDVEVVGRLMLDPFSLALYSSTGSDFAQVEKFVNEGMTLESAVDRLAQNMRRANG